jgi:predicted Rossmann fold flavoprotein
LAKLGHTVAKPTPTIVPLRVRERWAKSLAGTSLSFMKISFFTDGPNGQKKRAFSKTGKVLFTHFGLSGPLILNSAHAVAGLLQSGGEVTATIDAFPDTDFGPLDRRVVSLFDRNKNKMLKNVLPEIAPAGTSEAILSLMRGVDPDIKVHSVTQEERKRLVHLMKALPLTITGLMGYDWAVIADGGVPLKELDMKTMRSLKTDNLQIIGDLLHVNRPSGGYSLQLCWTTGYVAGSHV